MIKNDNNYDELIDLINIMDLEEKISTIKK